MYVTMYYWYSILPSMYNILKIAGSSNKKCVSSLKPFKYDFMSLFTSTRCGRTN